MLNLLQGVGPVLAGKLFKELPALAKAKSVDEIRQILRSWKHFEELPQSVKCDCIYAPIQKIARKQVDALARELPRVTIAGSYRRGKKELGDVDIIIHGNKVALPSKFVEVPYPKPLKKWHWVKYAEGTSKIALLMNIGKVVKVDLYFSTTKTYPFMLLYLTGSKEFNQVMRSYAKKKGYMLNQESLIDLKTGNPIKGISNERDIFNALGYRWHEPHEREIS